MGLSASKRVEQALRNSPDFDAACNSVYDECLDLSQHAFSGVRPYQLDGASERLHLNLSTVHPLVKKWVPSPPARTQVHRAFKIVIERSTDHSSDGETLGPSEFKAFAVELFRDAIVSNAGKAVVQTIPIGIAGIAGIGMATRLGKDLVGAVMGVYALGVGAAVYLSLSG
ncbi:PREDICTED: uncharacterized protein LOC104605260 [Nelumbo nucifera]|uniref:Uncharacterized protein LOC104605260 n=1 Tax=Nelumbo nucifera TaxID=4432 RepID=A0A1U8AKK0_NELNU|nr:PREDICTED: uncharacterized protein LOC104605260 [Nelumbo nucifera]